MWERGGDLDRDTKGSELLWKGDRCIGERKSEEDRDKWEWKEIEGKRKAGTEWGQGEREDLIGEAI